MKQILQTVLKLPSSFLWKDIHISDYSRAHEFLFEEKVEVSSSMKKSLIYNGHKIH